MNNIVLVNLESAYTSVYGIWQWDYGQILRIQSKKKLPKAVEVHFSLQEKGGESVTRIGTTADGVTDVPIPDSFLENNGATQDYRVHAFVYVENGESGNTEYKIEMSVKARPKPEVPGAPEEPELFKETIKAVNDAADRAETAEQNAKDSASKAEESATNASASAKAAEDAKTEALEVIGNKKQDALSAIQTQREDAVTAIQAKKEESLSAIQEQEKNSVYKVTEQADTEVQRIQNTVNESKGALDQSIEEASEKKNALDGSIQTADTSKANLDKSVETAGTVKSELDASTGKAKDVKAELDGSIQTAGEKQTALDTTVGKAEKLDTSLTKDIESGTQLQKDLVASGEKAVQDIQSAGTEQLGKMQTVAEEFSADREQVSKNKEDIETAQESIADLSDKKITKFYASNKGNTHLPDSDKGKIQDMFLYGKSEQVQYKGKNLLDLRSAISSGSGDGVNFTSVGNGVYKAVGTATGQAGNVWFKGGYRIKPKGDKSNVLITLKKGTTYYVSDCTIFTVSSDNKIISITKAYTPESDIDITGVRNPQLRIGHTYKENIYPQIEIGSTKTDFEPYTGGIPSPNPDYPQEIKAVVNPKVVVRGKNLLNATAQTQTINGVTFTVNADKTVTVNGTNTSSSIIAFSVVPTFTIKEDGEYKLTGLPKEQSITDIVWFGGTRIESAKRDVVLSLKKGEVLNLAIIVAGNGTVNNVLLKPMLSRDTTATYDDYEPYTEQSTTLPYTLYAIPVSSGGNITIGNQQYVADYVDVERGKLVRMCKEIDFTQMTPTNYALNPMTISEECRFGYTLIGIKKLLSSVTYSTGAGYIDNLSLKVDGTWDVDEIGIFSHGQNIEGNELSIRVPLNTKTKTKEYFKNIGGCKGIFQIATPEEIDLTPDQIQAFKSLSTNYPVTNIEVSSDQLDGYTVFNYPISMAEGWNYVKQQIGDTRDYIYDMDLQSAEAYVNSEYAVALTELEVM